MKKLFTILFTLVTVASFSQGGWTRPNRTYGNITYRAAFEKTLFFPTGCGAPTLNAYNLKQSAIYTDTCSSPSKLYWFDPKDSVWNEITAGGGGGGSYTNEEAQDAVGGILSNDFSYNDNTPLISLNTATKAIWDSSYSIDVFLIGGQSNAVPQGDSSLSPKPKQGTAYQYYNDVLNYATDPVGGTSTGTGTAWPSFAVNYYNKTGRKICFVQTAVGGSSMYQANEPDNLTWDVGGTLFDSSVSKTLSAMDSLRNRGFTPVFKGVLWVQGEEDAVNINGSIETVDQYKAALSTMIYNYRNTFSDSLGFYIFRTGTTTSGSDVGYAAIRQGEEDIADSMYNTIIVYRGTVDFEDRGFMDDNVHYNQSGLNEMGYYSVETVIKGDESVAYKTQTNKTGFGGVSHPSAIIELAANTTTTGALKFGAGGSLTATPQNMLVEFIDDGLYITDNNVRRKVATFSGTNVFTGANSFTGITLSGDVVLSNTTVDIGDATNYIANIYAFVVRSPTGVNLNIQSNAASNAILFKRGTTEDMRLSASGGRLLLKTTSDDGVNVLQVNGSAKATQFRLSALNTAPSSAADTGVLGEIRIVNGFIYVCVATNTWQRAAIATW